MRVYAKFRNILTITNAIFIVETMHVGGLHLVLKKTCKYEILFTGNILIFRRYHTLSCKLCLAALAILH